MNTKFISVLLTIILVSGFTTAFAYSTEERLVSCIPTKNLNIGAHTYQVSGLTGSVCVFRIQNADFRNKPDLICKVPSARMREMISFNPMTVQGVKSRYCVVSLKHVKY